MKKQNLQTLFHRDAFGRVSLVSNSNEWRSILRNKLDHLRSASPFSFTPHWRFRRHSPCLKLCRQQRRVQVSCLPTTSSLHSLHRSRRQCFCRGIGSASSSRLLRTRKRKTMREGDMVNLRRGGVFIKPPQRRVG